jgi:uncharacterized membrane protein
MYKLPESSEKIDFISGLLIHHSNIMKNKTSFLTLAGIMLISTFISCSKKDSNLPQPGTDVYFPKVKLIVANNCLACHSSSGTWAGRPTKFDTDSDISSLYSAIKRAVADPASPTNRRMPQGGSLSASDIDIIVKWFNKGGKVSD